MSQVANTIASHPDELSLSIKNAQTQLDGQDRPQQLWPWPRIILGWSAVAALILLGVSLFVAATGNGGVDHQGPVVWIDGKAYVLKDSQIGTRYVRAPIDLIRQSQIQLAGGNGLVARLRGDDPKVEKIKVGQTIITKAAPRTHRSRSTVRGAGSRDPHPPRRAASAGCAA